MQAIDPPLLLEHQISLEEMQQICTRHRAASEEVLRHPARLEIVRRGSVREDVDEEFTAGLERVCDFGHEQGVVFHVFEELDAEDAVVDGGVEGVRHDVAGHDGDVGEGFGGSGGVDVLLLSTGVGEGGDFAVGEELGEVEGERTPTTTMKKQC